MASDTAELLEVLEREGYAVRQSRRHWAVTGPGLERVVIACTGSDWRGLKNTLSLLQRNGYRFTFKGKRWARAEQNEPSGP